MRGEQGESADRGCFFAKVLLLLLLLLLPCRGLQRSRSGRGWRRRQQTASSAPGRQALAVTFQLFLVYAYTNRANTATVDGGAEKTLGEEALFITTEQEGHRLWKPVVVFGQSRRMKAERCCVHSPRLSP